MSVKHSTGGIPGVSAENRDGKYHEDISPNQSSVWASPAVRMALKTSPAGKDPKWCTPPTTSDSNALLLKPPSSPRRHVNTSSSNFLTPTQRVMLQEVASSQLELENVPDDEFFLVGPNDAFSPMETFAPQVVRPQPRRVGEMCQQETSLNAIGSQFFQCIGEDVDDGYYEPSISTMFDHEEYPAALTQVPLRLKPRPASLKDGQRAWESMSLCTNVYGGFGEENLG